MALDEGAQSGHLREKGVGNVDGFAADNYTENVGHRGGIALFVPD